MRLNSLRGQLLAWLLLPLAISMAVDTWLTYADSTATARVIQEQQLLGSARIIGEQVYYDDGPVLAGVPPAALELFEASRGDRVYYRVTAPTGVLLSGYEELAPPQVLLRAEEAKFFDAKVRGEPVRVVAFAQPVFGAPGGGPVLIQVAQTVRARAALARELWRHAALEQFLIVVLVVVLALIGLRRGLAPLLSLRDKVLRREPGALTPLDVSHAPAELKPLVAAINDYVRRLDDHMSAHDRFIANAAHQLRTPLTVLSTQASFAVRSDDAEARVEALRAIQRSVQSGVRVVQQLLTLSISQAGIGHPVQKVPQRLDEVVPRALEMLAGFAQARQIDLGCDLAGGPAPVDAVPSMLDELVLNLLDNAIRYSPLGGVVTVRVIASAATVVLRVEDNGPGIPVAEREHVFERFYRLARETQDGCGLGLAIVREIAAACGAVVTLADPPRGPGLVVTVEFVRCGGTAAEPPSAGAFAPTEFSLG